MSSDLERGFQSDERGGSILGEWSLKPTLETNHAAHRMLKLAGTLLLLVFGTTAISEGFKKSYNKAGGPSQKISRALLQPDVTNIPSLPWYSPEKVERLDVGDGIMFLNGSSSNACTHPQSVATGQSWRYWKEHIHTQPSSSVQSLWQVLRMEFSAKLNYPAHTAHVSNSNRNTPRLQLLARGRDISDWQVVWIQGNLISDSRNQAENASRIQDGWKRYAVVVGRWSLPQQFREINQSRGRKLPEETSSDVSVVRGENNTALLQEEEEPIDSAATTAFLVALSANDQAVSTSAPTAAAIPAPTPAQTKAFISPMQGPTAPEYVQLSLCVHSSLRQQSRGLREVQSGEGKPVNLVKSLFPMRVWR